MDKSKIVESRCGLLCSKCEYREKMDCQGCAAIDKPFWGDCPVKSCCESKNQEHCGQCSDFPCDLLKQFAYDAEQGDDGKRIETCREWAEKSAENKNQTQGLDKFDKTKGFNAEKFIFDVANQNAEALREYFAINAAICWHDSNEQFAVEEYIRANCEYPGKWNGELQRIEKTDDGIIIVAKIFSDDSAHNAVSFIKLDKECKIIRMDEYYSHCGEAPQWRKDMNIGKSIWV